MKKQNRDLRGGNGFSRINVFRGHDTEYEFHFRLFALNPVNKARISSRNASVDRRTGYDT